MFGPSLLAARLSAAPILAAQVLLASMPHLRPERVAMRFIFLILFFVLLVSWVFSFVVFHVAGGAIHILLVIAVIALIVHFVRGSSAA